MDVFVKKPGLGNIKPEMFTHLHAHSAHSLKDGSIPVDKLVDRQVEDGARACCLTDHGTMTGAWFLYDYIRNVKGYNIKHIIGLEAYLSLSRDELNEFLKDPKAIEDKEKRKLVRKKLAKKYHQILLAKNEKGYFNLVKIHNEAWENGFYYSPTTTKEVIFEHSEGVIVTTTCLASIWNQRIIEGRIKEAEKEIYEWKEVFGEDFYIELQSINYDLQRLVNVELIKLARKTKTPLIVTNDVHYIEKGDSKFHSLLLNLDKLKEGVDKEKLWEFEVDDLYIKNLEQMKDSWKRVHKSDVFNEAVFDECIHTVSDIVDKIESYTLESKPKLPDVCDESPFEELKKRVLQGFKTKVQNGIIPKNRIEEYQERTIFELKTIKALGAEKYFLICNEITNFCHQNNIAVGFGRGSAGGSLVLFLLDITGIDPIKYNLLFERFLNFNRRSKLIM